MALSLHDFTLYQLQFFKESKRGKRMCHIFCYIPVVRKIIFVITRDALISFLYTFNTETWGSSICQYPILVTQSHNTYYTSSWCNSMRMSCCKYIESQSNYQLRIRYLQFISHTVFHSGLALMSNTHTFGGLIKNMLISGQLQIIVATFINCFQTDKKISISKPIYT